METEITPHRIEQLALDARLQITDVLAKSGVSPSAYYRWRRGVGELRELNRHRLVDAVAALAAGEA